MTSLALFLSSNDTAAKIASDGDGSVTGGDRGEAFVMARFHTFTIGVPFITLPKALQFDWTNPPENNYIDTLVNAKLKKLRIEPSGVCTDEVFIRRVYLDITGILPTPEEVNAFVNDKSPKAHEKLVDRLLASPRYGERQARRWLDVSRYADSDGYNTDGTDRKSTRLNSSH